MKLHSIVLPKEWRDTMKPLQDKCVPSPYEDLDQMFLLDEGKSISDMFEEFDRVPIGVASLAQVHVGRLRDTGREVAVKVRTHVLLNDSVLNVRLTASTPPLARILRHRHGHGGSSFRYVAVNAILMPTYFAQ